MLRVATHVNENSIYAILDSGATQSMISLKLANKYKLEYNENFKPIRLANGALSKRFYGTTKLVTVKLKNSR